MVAKITLEIGENDQFGIFDKDSFHNTVKVDIGEWDHMIGSLHHELSNMINKARKAKGSMDDE
jgi:hypothetical protein